MLSPEWPDKAVTTVNLTNKASTDMTSMMQESMVCAQCCDAWYQPELMQVSFSWGIPSFLIALQKSQADCGKHHYCIYAVVALCLNRLCLNRWRQLSMKTACQPHRKKKKGDWIDHGPVQPPFAFRVNYPCYILSCRETDHHFGLCWSALQQEGFMLHRR